jgi:signal transduction histidine kinase
LPEWLKQWADPSETAFAAAIVAVTLSIGYLDYATGPHVAMQAFYLLPLTLAAWRVGLRFALLIAILSVAVWFAGNAANGDEAFHYSALTAWNSCVRLTEFVVMAIAVDRLRSVQRDLEVRVRERTEALERAQHDLLQNSEREQRRIGQDLHDGLCQHLAGTAFLCEALHQDLVEKNFSEAAKAQRVVELLKEGILLSRQTAKGLDPVEIGAEGLMEALDEFSATTSTLFDVSCRFECDSPVPIKDSAVAGNLFRIAQEAVRNAINHGRAVNILIGLSADEDGIELCVEDDGIGIANTVQSSRGMGMIIMPRRAASIGGNFEVRSRQPGGTVVRCFLPVGHAAKHAAGDTERDKVGA